MASKPKIPRKKNAYEMPKKLKPGTILVDNSKVQWIVGSSIGKGGFGEIYCVSKVSESIKNEKDYPYVLKIEPHQNGPLFVEMHFYMRNAKLEDIEAFKKSRKLSSLGMPHFIGSGSHELEGVKHRFIVMPRYGQDIWSIYLKNGKAFPNYIAYRLTLQMLDVLEYIHNCTYVHGDLKGANMLLKNDSQAYLVDFGLASHYTTSKEYKPDVKKMHNGTIEYTSIDAHYGVPTMRGDLEILGYNLIHWVGGKFPWEKCLTDPVKVRDLKEKFRGNAKGLMKECAIKSDTSTVVQQFFENVYSLKFNEKPNYDKCKKIFLQALKTLQKPVVGPIVHLKHSDKNTGASPKTKRSPAAKPSAARVTTRRSKTENVGSDKQSQSSVVDSASVHLSTPLKGKGSNIQKVCQVNIDLDISIDTDVVVNVRRKNKPDKSKKPETQAVEKLNGNKEDHVSSDDEVIEATPPPVPVSRKRKQTSKDSTETNTKVSRPMAVIPIASMRAGEYKGKKAKN